MPILQKSLPRILLDLTNPLDYFSGVITIAETSEFSRRARKLLSEEERNELIYFLSSSPKTGHGGYRRYPQITLGQGRQREERRGTDHLFFPQ